jgi:hypothetical protein
MEFNYIKEKWKRNIKDHLEQTRKDYYQEIKGLRGNHDRMIQLIMNKQTPAEFMHSHLSKGIITKTAIEKLGNNFSTYPHAMKWIHLLLDSWLSAFYEIIWKSRNKQLEKDMIETRKKLIILRLQLKNKQRSEDNKTSSKREKLRLIVLKQNQQLKSQILKESRKMLRESKRMLKFIRKQQKRKRTPINDQTTEKECVKRIKLIMKERDYAQNESTLNVQKVKRIRLKIG